MGSPDVLGVAGWDTYLELMLALDVIPKNKTKTVDFTMSGNVSRVIVQHYFDRRLWTSLISRKCNTLTGTYVSHNGNPLENIYICKTPST